MKDVTATTPTQDGYHELFSSYLFHFCFGTFFKSNNLELKLPIDSSNFNYILKSTYHRNLQKLKLKNLDFNFAHKNVLSLHSAAKLYRNGFDQCSIRAPAERALASITNK